MDWAVHLAVSPGKQLHLMEQAMQNMPRRFGDAALGGTARVPETALPDRRFAGEGWQKYPFNVWSQAHQHHWQLVAGRHDRRARRRTRT